MAAMSEMNLVIEELHTAANALISAADSLAQMYSTPEETETELLQERKPLSLDEVRDILRRRCEEGYAADVKQMIADLGAKSLPVLTHTRGGGAIRRPSIHIKRGDPVKTISCDIETFSSVDLAKAGVYKYAESPDFEILLFGYSVDGGDVRVVDLAAGETIPAEVLDALTDDSVIKTAHNSNFERVCLSRYLSDLGISLDPFNDSHPLSTECARFLNPAGWHCTMIWAAYMGLPLSLADTGAVLGLEKQKLSEGKDLIRYFCKPCEPTKTNGGRTRNRPADAPDKWALFKSYNLRDVETELEIEKRLSKFPVPEDVWDQYHIDQEINDRGIAIDETLVENAIRMDARSRAELTEMMQKLTNLDNPNSVQQMKQWLINNGMEIDSLGKKQVQALLQDAPPQLREVLLLRQQLAKSSVKKYIAMKNAVCEDGRVRGMFQFYGAVRSGRWAGRLVQLQNLYRNSMPDLEAARNLVREGDYDTVKMLYGAVPDVLAELVRTAFIPRAGQKFIVSDFSAVEARVIAWLAGEQWRMDVFRDGGDIYCASASQMFKVPVQKHGVNGHLRQKGKIAELALGYGGSIGALKAMGALDILNMEIQPALIWIDRGVVSIHSLFGARMSGVAWRASRIQRSGA